MADLKNSIKGFPFSFMALVPIPKIALAMIKPAIKSFLGRGCKERVLGRKF